MTESKAKREERAAQDADRELAEQGGARDPESYQINPAELGPATTHVESDAHGAESPETAPGNRLAKDKAGKDKK